MKVAAVQFAPVFQGVQENVQSVIETVGTLATDGVRLAVFPEAFLTGYCFASFEEAFEAAIPSGGEALEKIAGACAENDIFAIVGYAERDEDKVYNTAGVFGPPGFIGKYRKTHIPFLGLDRFATAGQDLPIFDIDGAQVAIAICYDIRIPELSRCYALSGADIICVSTNWPESAEGSSDLVCPTRAMENHVYVVAADRVGSERGYNFIGKSKIIDPLGRIVVEANHAGEAVIVAEIDPVAARNKRIVKNEGEYELPLFDSRNPTLYKQITDDRI
jgi:predicted amidohydrolase